MLNNMENVNKDPTPPGKSGNRRFAAVLITVLVTTLFWGIAALFLISRYEIDGFQLSPRVPMSERQAETTIEEDTETDESASEIIIPQKKTIDDLIMDRKTIIFQRYCDSVYRVLPEEVLRAIYERIGTECTTFQIVEEFVNGGQYYVDIGEKAEAAKKVVQQPQPNVATPIKP